MSAQSRPSPDVLRRELEVTLAQRAPGAFTVHDRTAPELAASGVAALDELTGGFPRGALTEIFGPASSGRTTALIAALAAATSRGEACCLIDAADSFDPESAAAAGVALERVLWVRCGRAASYELRAKSKSKNPNSVFARSSQLVARSSYRRLEQALKAADLVLQAGGFGLLIMDVAGVHAIAARRVPLASWFRFRRAVENTRTVLLLISPAPLAQSAAALVLQTKPAETSVETGHALSPSARSAKPSHAQLLTEVNWQFDVMRSRSTERKPPQRAKATVRSRANFYVAPAPDDF